VAQTSFADFTWLTSLECIQGIIQLVANPQMQTLAGLSKLITPPQAFLWNGPTVGSLYQNLVDISALQPVANCTGTVSSYGPGNLVAINYVLGNLQINSLTCYMATWDSVCSFLASGQTTCPNTELPPPVAVPPPPAPLGLPTRRRFWR
jgi:hypothetical protein